MKRLFLAVVVVALSSAACSGDDSGPGLGFEPDNTEPTAGPSDDTGGVSGLTGSDAILVGQRFTPTDYQSADGSFLSVLPDTSPWFEFTAGGSVSGHDGCNGFTATFIVSGGYTEFGTTLTTSDDGQIIAMGNFEAEGMACADDVTAQATAITTALDSANRWVWLDPSFILRDSRSTNILVAVAE